MVSGWCWLGLHQTQGPIVRGQRWVTTCEHCDWESHGIPIGGALDVRYATADPAKVTLTRKGKGRIFWLQAIYETKRAASRS